MKYKNVARKLLPLMNYDPDMRAYGFGTWEECIFANEHPEDEEITWDVAAGSEFYKFKTPEKALEKWLKVIYG